MTGVQTCALPICAALFRRVLQNDAGEYCSGAGQPHPVLRVGHGPITSGQHLQIGPSASLHNRIIITSGHKKFGGGAGVTKLVEAENEGNFVEVENGT